MTISEHFNLNKSQAELDFINIDPDNDIPLFLDPHFLSKRVDRWSIEATLTLRSFFQEIIDLIRANNFDDARLLFDHLHEPNVIYIIFYLPIIFLQGTIGRDSKMIG